MHHGRRHFALVWSNSSNWLPRNTNGGGRHNNRGSSRSSPAIFFFFLKILLFRNVRKSWWCYGQTALPKIAPRRFLMLPPLNAIAINAKIGETMGKFPTPCPMDRRIIATLKPKKYPLLGFNVAKSFVSAPPPLVSHARGKNLIFLPRRREQLRS